MKKEIPPRTMTAPMAMNRVLPLLSVLPPEVFADVFWMTVGVALVVDGVGDTGSPGDSGLLDVVGSGTAGVVPAPTATEPRDRPRAPTRRLASATTDSTTAPPH